MGKKTLMNAEKAYPWIILLPLLYTLVAAVVNYLFVASHSAALATTSQELFIQTKAELIWATLLLLLPNALLSFFLAVYRRTRPNHPGEALGLCLFSLLGGTLPVAGIYVLYYRELFAVGSTVTGLMYGFPMVYLLGMMTAWFLGAILVQIRR